MSSVGAQDVRDLTLVRDHSKLVNPIRRFIDAPNHPIKWKNQSGEVLGSLLFQQWQRSGRVFIRIGAEVKEVAESDVEDAALGTPLESPLDGPAFRQRIKVWRCQRVTDRMRKELDRMIAKDLKAIDVLDKLKAKVRAHFAFCFAELDVCY